jgi:hypothetical protein
MIPDLIEGDRSKNSETRFDRAHFFSFDESCLTFEVVYFVLSADYNRYMDVQQAINLEIKSAFEAKGIDFAFPTRTLHVNSSNMVTTVKAIVVLVVLGGGVREWQRVVLEKTRPAWDLEHWPLGRRLVVSGVAVGAAAGVSAYVLNRLTGFFWRWGVHLVLPLPLEGALAPYPSSSGVRGVTGGADCSISLVRKPEAMESRR